VGWRVRKDDVIEGAIGDPFAFRMQFTATLPEDETPPPNFEGHTWLCQIRKFRTSSLVLVDFEVIDDSTVDNVVDVTFAASDTTGLPHNVMCVLGVSTVEGTYSPWTAVAAHKLVAFTPTARPDEPTP
jgi:hypothetical protein